MQEHGGPQKYQATRRQLDIKTRNYRSFDYIYLKFYKITSIVKKGKRRSVVAQGWGWETVKWKKKPFHGYEIVLKLDCGWGQLNDYIHLQTFIELYILKGLILLYANYTSIKLQNKWVCRGAVKNSFYNQLSSNVYNNGNK